VQLADLTSVLIAHLDFIVLEVQASRLHALLTTTVHGQVQFQQYAPMAHIHLEAKLVCKMKHNAHRVQPVISVQKVVLTRAINVRLDSTA
jgi:hypothetical protein